MEQKKDNWRNFLISADDFFILYALSSAENLSNSASLFCVGHAIELYLKAAYAFQNNDNVNGAIERNHDIGKLIIDCKNKDKEFLKSIDLDKFSEIYGIINENQKRREVLWISQYLGSQECHTHLLDFYCKNEELFTIVESLNDLKYPGVMKKYKAYSYVTRWPDRYWINLFKELRGYLNYHPEGGFDHIVRYIKNGENSGAKDYLKKLIEK